MPEIRDGEDLRQWSQLEIRLNAFRRSTIPQKQFIIIIIPPSLWDFHCKQGRCLPTFSQNLTKEKNRAIECPDMHAQGIMPYTISDISRFFLGRPVTSWSSPFSFPPRWMAEIFKPCASRCSKNALPGCACS